MNVIDMSNYFGLEIVQNNVLPKKYAAQQLSVQRQKEEEAKQNEDSNKFEAEVEKLVQNTTFNKEKSCWETYIDDSILISILGHISDQEKLNHPAVKKVLDN